MFLILKNSAAFKFASVTAASLMAANAASAQQSSELKPADPSMIDPAIAEPSFAGVFMQMLPVYVLVIAVYYLLVLKPQQKKQTAQQQFKSSLKKGDSVLTSSGIVGKVVSIDDDFLGLEIAPNTKIKIAASHVVGRPEDLVGTDKAGAEKSSAKAA